MKTPLIVVAASFVALSPAIADDAGRHPLGDHPAVVVQRLQRNAGYDYASKFYPHPAWLWLLAAPPPDGPLPLAQRGDGAPAREVPARGSDGGG